MPLLESLNNLNRRFAWSLLGFVLAGIFGAMSVYTEFFRDTRPAIQFEVISDSSVLDVREDIGDLEIVYSGTDLRKSNQSLRIIVIRVANIGSEDILKAYYDDKAPLGFSITNGTLISAEVQDTSESYLSEQMSVEIIQPSQAIFSPVILGRNQYYTVKTLIIHPESNRPRIVPTGRVARISTISFIDVQVPEVSGFWSQTFSGSLWVQVTRLPSYTVGLIIAVFAVLAPVLISKTAIENHQRRKKVRQFKKTAEVEIQEEDEFLFRHYIESGTLYLEEFKFLLSDEADLDDFAKQAELYERRFLPYDQLHDSPEYRETELTRSFSFLVFRMMNSAGLIERNENHHRVKPRFASVLIAFRKYLSIVGD